VGQLPFVYGLKEAFWKRYKSIRIQWSIEITWYDQEIFFNSLLMIINFEKKMCQIIDVAISRIERIIPNLQEGLGSDENTEEV